MRVVVIMVVAFCVAALVTHWLRPLARRVGLVHRPDALREPYAKPTPVVGGLGILAGLGVGMLFSPSLGSAARHQFIVLFIAALPVVAVGLLDDRRGASRTLRLFAHGAAALVLVGMGGMVIENIGDLMGWHGNIILDVWGVPFTVLCVMGIISATNMLDRFDGLAGGVSLVALTWYAVVAFLEGMAFQSLLAYATLGAVAGFLIFNARTRFRRRASVHLGDTGAAVLGLLLAWLSISVTQQPGSTFPAAMSAWVLGIPLLEIAGVLASRLSPSRHPADPLRKHFARRLMRAGFSGQQAVGLLVLAAIAFGAVALAGWQWNLPQSAMTLGAFLVLFVYLASPRSERVRQWLSLLGVARRERPRGRIIFINKYFHPDISATSQLLSDLAFHLAEMGHDVHVIASRQRYGSGKAVLQASERVRGVQVRRVWTSSFGRHRLVGRALDYLSFYVSASLRVATLARAIDVVVVKTDPPLLSVPVGLVARLCGAQMVNWMQDVYPEIAERLHVLPSKGPLAGTLRRLRNYSLRRASMNVVLGRRMHEEVSALIGRIEPGHQDSPVTIVANWSDGALVKPLEKSSLRAAWGLEGRFVVGYSGNMGRVHEFETILRACSLLQDEPDIVFLFVGSGHRKGATQKRAAALGLRNLMFQDYQPVERLAESLSVADVHLAGLLPDLEGLVVPSKFYGIAAAGRPTVYVGDPKGEVPRLLHRFDVGVTVPEGDAAALAHVIRTLRDNPHMRQGMGVRARQAFERHWDRPIALGQWQKVLEGVLLRAGSSSQASQSILPVGGAPTPEQSPSSRAL